MPVLRRWVSLHKPGPGDGRWGIWPEDRDKAPTRQQMDDEYARHSADVAKQIKDLETELMEAPGEIASV